MSLSLQIQSVAVIGGGPSGIVTAKLLLAESHFSEVVVYEQRNSLGGIWNYDDPMFPSSVYIGLESNIPTTIMEYSNSQFPLGTPLLPSRSAFRDYIEKYGEEIEPVVRLRHRVISAKPTNDQLTAKWQIDVEDIMSQSVSQRIFDAVVVANGRYDKPNIPDISGLDTWQTAYPKDVLHSKAYHDASLYKDKKVLVIGYSASGTDIVDQLISVSVKPILVSQSSNDNLSSGREAADESIKMVSGIAEFIVKDRAVRFVDGAVESGIDTVILCTGYLYDYPFLSGIPTFRNGQGNQDTYQHIFWTQAPSLAFSLLPLRVTAFPFSEIQAAVIARVWSSRLTLPNAKDMKDWVANRRESRDAAKEFHKMGFPDEVNYINTMLDWCLQAENRNGLPNNGQGLLPPHWTCKKRWLREVQADIRKAVVAQGAERHNITNMEQIGFHYPDDRSFSSNSSKIVRQSWIDFLMNLFSGRT